MKTKDLKTQVAIPNVHAQSGSKTTLFSKQDLALREVVRLALSRLHSAEAQAFRMEGNIILGRGWESVDYQLCCIRLRDAANQLVNGADANRKRD
jgi:hypothetical protein